MSKTAEPTEEQSQPPQSGGGGGTPDHADRENALDIRALKEMKSADLTKVARELDIDGAKLLPLLHYNGLPIASASIVERISADHAHGAAA